jgi:hypothetical protein
MDLRIALSRLLVEGNEDRECRMDLGKGRVSSTAATPLKGLTNGVRGDLYLDLAPCQLFRCFAIAIRERPLRRWGGGFTICVASVGHLVCRVAAFAMCMQDVLCVSLIDS